MHKIVDVHYRGGGCPVGRRKDFRNPILRLGSIVGTRSNIY